MVQSALMFWKDLSSRSVYAWLLRRSRRFVEDRSGAVAIVFALCLLPLMGMVEKRATDYSRLQNVRTKVDGGLTRG